MSDGAAGPAAATSPGLSRLRRLDGRVNAALTQYKDSRNAAEPYLRLAGTVAYLVVMLVRRAQAPSTSADVNCPPTV